MRIDAYNKVSQLYSTNNVKKTAKPSKTGFSDKLEISQTGLDYRVAKQAVTQASDAREDRVNEIKKRIESGTYNISMEEVAERIVNRYFDELA